MGTDYQRRADKAQAIEEEVKAFAERMVRQFGPWVTVDINEGISGGPGGGAVSFRMHFMLEEPRMHEGQPMPGYGMGGPFYPGSAF